MLLRQSTDDPEHRHMSTLPLHSTKKASVSVYTEGMPISNEDEESQSCPLPSHRPSVPSSQHLSSRLQMCYPLWNLFFVNKSRSFRKDWWRHRLIQELMFSHSNLSASWKGLKEKEESLAYAGHAVLTMSVTAHPRVYVHPNRQPSILLFLVREALHSRKSQLKAIHTDVHHTHLTTHMTVAMYVCM